MSDAGGKDVDDWRSDDNVDWSGRKGEEDWKGERRRRDPGKRPRRRWRHEWT